MARSWRLRLAIVLGVAAVVLAGAAAAGAVQIPPRPPSTPSPAPTSAPAPRTTPNLQEERRQRAEILQQKPSTVTAVAGPETRGSTIRLAGKVVTLPSDAYVSRYIIEGLCPPGQKCPELPIYEIRRGNSTIMVSAKSGAIIEEKIAPGEEGAFDFLKRALP